MNRALARIALALATLSLPAVASTTMPFELVDNRVMIPVSLNGHGPYRLLLDTGAAGLVVRNEVAADLSLPRFAEHEESGVGENTVTSHASRVDSVRIAGLSLGRQDCTIISFDDTPAVWGRERFDGVIGLQVFERWVVGIDYTALRVTFSDPATFRPSGGSATVPFKRPGHIPIATATIDGVTGRFGIDTGARSSLILSGPFVEKNRLRQKYGATFETITGWGIGGPVRSQLARVSSMTLGGRLTMRGIVARLSTQKSGVLASTSIDGLIGGDVLRRFTVTFDYSRGVMLLEPNARFEKQDNWDGTGMWIGLRDDGFEVLDLLPGGPAAVAGVKKGDTILAIDGRPTRLLSLPVERLALYYDGRPRTLTLRLRADGAEERTVHLVMKRLV